jgi:hypothetical protein
MALNLTQFQHGMSIPEFLRSFGTEAQCAEAVKRARWPNGRAGPTSTLKTHPVERIIMTLPLLGALHSHSITRLCPAGPRARFSQTPSG